MTYTEWMRAQIELWDAQLLAKLSPETRAALDAVWVRPASWGPQFRSL